MEREGDGEGESIIASGYMLGSAGDLKRRRFRMGDNAKSI